MVSISAEVEKHIRENCTWSKLPPSAKAVSVWLVGERGSTITSPAPLHSLWPPPSLEHLASPLPAPLPPPSRWAMLLGCTTRLSWRSASRTRSGGGTTSVGVGPRGEAQRVGRGEEGMSLSAGLNSKQLSVCRSIPAVTITMLIASNSLPAVRFVQRDERKYFEELLSYSKEHFVVS